ncbi:hypothetical protein [Streptomyces sp. NPDC088739]|uniref:hypothetical protein n=1 Tax=Streptomyces sp. NPDC088739 TaxID=3365882 RepID=UPI003825A1CF
MSDETLAHMRPRMELAGMRAVGAGNWRHRRVPTTTGGKGEGGAPSRLTIREGCAVEQVWEWVEKHPQGGGRFRNLRSRLAMVPPVLVTPIWMDAALGAPVLLTVVPASVAGGRFDAFGEGVAVDVAAHQAVLDEVLADAARSFSLWAGLVAADFGETR